MIDINFTMPFEQYAKAEGVNSSLLKEMRRSPAHARYYIQSRLEEDNKREATALKLGRLVHKFVHEPAIAMDGLVVKPESMKFSTNEGKAWRDEQENQGKHIITQDERDQLLGMVSSVLNCKSAREFIEASYCETSVFCETKVRLDRDDETTVTLKARVDQLITRGNAIADLKTAADASPHGFSKAMWDFGYYMQAPFYVDAVNNAQQALGKDYGHKKLMVFIVVEKTPPYPVYLYCPDTEAMKRGRSDYKALLAQYVRCKREDRWPGPPADITHLSLPRWANAA
ncbi:MAG TPA: PD-(D/E)XK nuclease-like domain-containing protein [Methylomirabilota bacterium]|nr:PD-(D/E)XK nuclease-like domain-containing protein [Methylomirabilota bacterium]